jgi:hypothetical protein
VQDQRSTRRIHRRSLGARLIFAGLLLLGVAFDIACLKVAQVDVAKLLAGLPRLAAWAGRAWPLLPLGRSKRSAGDRSRPASCC